MERGLGGQAAGRGVPAVGQAGSGPFPRNVTSRVGVSPEMSGFSSTLCQASRDLPWVLKTSEVKWLAQSHTKSQDLELN